MELSLEQALEKGIAAHRAENFNEADRYYTAILKIEPKHPDANHNMGVLAINVDKINEALPFFKVALEGNPKITQFWLSYIDTLIKLNRIDEAKIAFDQAQKEVPQVEGFNKLRQMLEVLPKSSTEPITKNLLQDPPEHQVQPLVSFYKQGKLQQALTEALNLLSEFPQSATVYNIIGAVNQGLGKLTEAIDAYNKALLINPTDAEIHNNIGVTLKKLGRLGEAIEAYNKALSINPTDEEIYNNLGNALKENGNFNESIEAYKKALSIKPEYADAHYNMGIALNQQGQLDKAILAYTKALSIIPNYAEVYNDIGITLYRQNKFEEAIESYEKALSLKPDYAEAYNNKGIALQEYGKLNKAIESYEKALSLKPDYAKAHRHLSNITKYTADDNRLIQVQLHYNKNETPDDSKCDFAFSLAKMYSDVGNLSQAYKYLLAGNSLQKKMSKYKIDKDKKVFQKLKKTQFKLKQKSLEIKDISNRLTPIFILGMPRSGTTLVEQIISSHSKVNGLGELPYVAKFGFSLATGEMRPSQRNIQKFRENYLSELTKLSKGSTLVTDKSPTNFNFIPLIYAALPESKIIHVHRDPAAVCWSNFKTRFTAGSLPYSYDLRDLVAYYKLYHSLMQVWRSKYNNQFYDLDYEKLTNNQEHETKKLINYLGIDWERLCLTPEKNKRPVKTASQQQVNQKIYKGSSKAWLQYKDFLNGTFDSLLSL